jgi:hypothetical protein
MRSVQIVALLLVFATLSCGAVPDLNAIWVLKKTNCTNLNLLTPGYQLLVTHNSTYSIIQATSYNPAANIGYCLGSYFRKKPPIR